MDEYTKLMIATIVMLALIVIAVILLIAWFKAEKKLAKYRESILYKPKIDKWRGK